MPGDWEMSEEQEVLARAMAGVMKEIRGLERMARDAEDLVVVEALMGNDAVEREQLNAEERAERNRIADEESNEYWAHHCPEHGSELLPSGECVECSAEMAAERISDR